MLVIVGGDVVGMLMLCFVERSREPRPIALSARSYDSVRFEFTNDINVRVTNHSPMSLVRKRKVRRTVRQNFETRTAFWKPFKLYSCSRHLYHHYGLGS